jgi:nucleoside 2-deoxyribosyltransferase
MRIFLICPVRNISPAFKADVEAQIAHLRNEGHLVYCPLWDTNQSQPARRIVQTNRETMEQADAVYVAWDGESQGVLFDLGMAFAMRKPLSVLTGMMPAMTTAKSFQNLCYGWEDAGA